MINSNLQNQERIVSLTMSIYNRKVIVEDGRFFCIDESGNKQEVSREDIISFFDLTAEMLDGTRDQEFDNMGGYLSVLNSLDQSIFDRKYWRGYELGIKNTVAEIKSFIKNGCSENREYIKHLIYHAIRTYDIEYDVMSRYIFQLVREGVLDVGILREARFFEGYSLEIISELVKDRTISTKILIEMCREGIVDRDDAVTILGGTDIIATHYKEALRQKRRKDAILFSELLGKNKIYELYSNGEISLHDLQREGFSKQEIEQLPEEIFVKLLKRGLPQGIEFSSDELINEYMQRLSGKSIIELSQKGFIEPQTVLSLLDIEIDEEQQDRAIKPEDLIKMYSPELVCQLLIDGKMNAEHIQKIYHQLYKDTDESEKNKYIQNLIRICREKMNKEVFSRLMVSLLENASIPIEVFKGLYISTDYIEELYYEGVISTERIIDYYSSGIIDIKAVEMVYGSDHKQLLQDILKGTVDKTAICLIPKDVISDSLIDGKIPLKSLIDFYLMESGINMEMLKEILSDYEIDLDLRNENGEDISQRQLRIVDCIDSSTDERKIREMFIYNVLTHGDIIELKEKGIISEEQFEAIAKIDREKEYDAIFGKTIISSTDNTDTQEPPEHGPRVNTIQDSKEKHTMSEDGRTRFFKALGASDFRDIKTLDSDSPFRGYTLIGFRQYGIVVFENFERPDNATYIMTLEELKGLVRQEDDGSVVLTRGKRAIRDEITRGKAVQTRNHVSTWGYNVIESMRDLSKDADDSISSTRQSELSEMMIDDYFEPRILANQGDQTTLQMIYARILKEKRAIILKQLQKEETRLKGLTRGTEKRNKNQESPDGLSGR